MATAGNMKFSVVLEAVTAAFNKAVTEARSNYTNTTTSIVGDSNKVSTSTEALASKLKDIFQAKDAAGITNALKAATAELQGTSKGATLTAQELAKIGTAGKQAVNELTGALKTANAEVKLLAASKATPADIDAAKNKVIALKVEIETAKAEYGRFQTAASASMRAAAAETDKAAIKAKEAGKAIYDSLNIKSGGALKAEIATITTQLQSFKANAGAPAAEIERVTGAAKARIAELRGELGGISPVAKSAGASLLDIGKGAIAVAGVTAGFAAIKSGIEAVLETTVKFEGVLKQLEFATGSAKQAGIEFDFVRGVAKDLGLELLSAAKGYAGLAASTKGTALEGEATRKVFLGVASAAASLGLSADETNGVMLALSQIASKGVVSMEELRGQMGERLPGAMAVAAKSMGVSVAELGKLVENGLDSVTFLKAFGPAMVEAFGPTAAKNVQTLGGSINLMKNQLTELLVSLGQGGVGQAASKVFGDIANALEQIKKGMASLDPSTVSAITAVFQNLYGIISETFGVLMTLVVEAATQLDSLGTGVSGIISAFTGLDAASEKVSFLTRTLQGVSIVLGTIEDGIAAFSILLTVGTGIAQKFFADFTRGLSTVTFGEVSKSLKAFSVEMDASATASFGRAQQKAMDFKSAAVEALDKTAEASVKAGATVIASSTEAAAKAAAAYAATGESAQTSFRKAEIAAQDTAKSIEIVGLKGVEVMVGLSKTGTEVAATFSNIAKEIGITIPPSVRTIADLGIVFGEVAAKSNKLAADIAKNLPEAIAKLTGPELQLFQSVFIAGLEKAGASAEYVKNAIIAIATAGAKSLGVDMAGSLTKLSQGFKDSEVNLQGLIRKFDALKAGGVDAGDLIGKALAAMLAKASNPVEIQHLIELYKQMGVEGKIGADALAQGLVNAKNKIDEMTPGINSLAEAFKTFGMQSREEAKLLSDKYSEAFAVLKASGKATASELMTAFTAYAEQSIKANAGVVDALVQARAAALGLEVSVDSAGKVIVRSMGAGATAVDGMAGAMNNAAGATQAQVDAMDTLMMKYTLTADYTKNQIRLVEEQTAATQKLIDTENKRLNRDSQGFSIDPTTGQRVNMRIDSQRSVYENAKSQGLTEQQALAIMKRFMTDQGEKIGWSDGGLQGAMKGENWGTALQKAIDAVVLDSARTKAPQPIMAPSKAASDSGTATNATTITLKTASGAASSVITAPGTTVDDVISTLRAASMASISRG